MAVDVFALLGENPILLIFTVIGLGYPIANIRIADVPVGPVIGVLLVGLLFGHFGFSAPPGASSFGVNLFIFSVGIQAGPHLFTRPGSILENRDAGEYLRAREPS